MILIMCPIIDTFTRPESRPHFLTEGDLLFRRGDSVHSMFLIVEGEIRLVRYLPHGPALTMQVAGAGSVLAEASLFATEYHCDALATAPSRLLSISRTAMETAITLDPRFARAWSAHLAREIQRARTQVEIVSLKTVAERLDAWLTLRGPELPLKGAWRSLASEISVTPEALYRELARRRLA